MTAIKTVQPDTAELTVLMSEDEATAITLKIKQYTGVVCTLVKEAHDKQAWRALGYPTWTAYCKTEFNVGKSRSYQLVKYAEVIALGSDTTGLPESTIVDSLPEGTARGVNPQDLAAALTEAFASVPKDAPIATRSELLAAVLEHIVGPSAPEPDEDLASEEPSTSDAKTSDEGTPAPPASDQPVPVSDPLTTGTGKDSGEDRAPAAPESHGEDPTAPGAGGGLTGDTGTRRGPGVTPPSPTAMGPLVDQHMTIAALFDLDPCEVVRDTEPEHVAFVRTLVDDLADWCHRHDQAIKEQA